MKLAKLAASFLFVASLASSLHAGCSPLAPELSPAGVAGAFGLIGGAVLIVRANKKK